MVTRQVKKRGTTLIELMIVIAILGSIVMLGPELYRQIRRFFFLSNARVEIQRNARTSMAVMTRRIRQAQSASLRIDRYPGQPYYSRLQFRDIDGQNVVYYQLGKNLMINVASSTKTLTSDIRYLAFALPKSDDMGIISVSITLEKSIYEGRTKALHMASEKVRVMN